MNKEKIKELVRKYWVYGLILIFIIGLLFLFSDKISYLISIGLFGIILTWIADRIKDYLLNKQLKELLIEELKDNLLTLNENLWWAKESGRLLGKFPTYFLQNKIFNSLISSNKMVILSKDVRKHLFKFHRGVDYIYLITSTPNTSFSLVRSNEQHKYYIDMLQDTKDCLKETLHHLGKDQLYKELERKGTKHELKNITILPTYNAH